MRSQGRWTGLSGQNYSARVPQPVTHGSMLQCSFGAAPSPITVLPLARVMASSQPAATILDNKPFLNIMPFGVCSSLANPAVASATAAAFGVLTPMPCTPVTGAPWAPGSPKTLIGGKPALTNSSKCVCSFGGVIQVTVAPAVTIAIP